jgi:hypothetical protein
MSASVPAETLTRTQQLEDHRGSPSVDNAQQKVRFEEQSPSRNSQEAAGPDESGFETFIDGGGI